MYLFAHGYATFFFLTLAIVSINSCFKVTYGRSWNNATVSIVFVFWDRILLLSSGWPQLCDPLTLVSLSAELTDVSYHAQLLFHFLESIL